MKSALKMINSESPAFGQKGNKTISTYRMDETMREMADIISLLRSLMYGNKAETYTKLYQNLMKEELYRLKTHERFQEIIENATKK